MKYQGKISNWQDGKGFGFVEPIGGGQRAFVHIKAFTAQSRRPANGEIIIYNLAVDNNKRYRAEQIKFMADNQRLNTHSKPKQGNLLVMAFTFLFCVALVWAVFVGRLPMAIASLYLFMSIVAYIAYGLDKAAAKNGKWRIKENTLHLFALAGGWPGALFAQNKLRHKSSKGEFKVVLWITVGLNLGGLYYLLSDKGANFLSNIISSIDSLLLPLEPYFLI
jgi:uncharacterized membrane protein YsdA (DUF1294 family)/cold shock CspA family protein